MGWITKNGNRIYIDDGLSLESALVDYYSKKTPTVYLEPKEYGRVMSEINTWYKKEYKDRPIISKAIGDYVYTFENYEYNEYRFIGRDKIEKSYSFIDEELDKHGKRK